MRDYQVMGFFVYILECSDGSYYTGYTTNMKRRYQEHVEGSEKCKYTRSFPPLRIAACWQIKSDLSTALQIESGIKRLVKTDKATLIENPVQLPHALPAIDSELCSAVDPEKIQQFSVYKKPGKLRHL